MDNLSHIKIKGFKSIKELDLRLKSINVLIGANGAGKSNFVSIFRLLENIYNQRLQSYIKQNGGAERFLYFGSKTTNQIRINLTFSADKDVVNGYLSILQKDNENNTLYIEDFASIHNTEKYQNPYYDSITTDYESLIKNHINDIAGYSKEFLKQCKLYHFHDTSSTAKFKSSQDMGENKFLDSFASNLAPFLYRLKNDFPKDYKNIVQAVQTVAPYFQDFDFNIEGDKILLRWQHVNDLSNLGFSAQTLSDGTARFICMATLFLQPKELRPATIVLDEPEIGLHPDALTVLSEVIKAVANDGAQVIISTQSVTLANCFEPDDFIVVDYEDGESKFERFGKEKQEKLKDWLEDFQMGTTWEENMLGGMPK
ncbi:Gll1843 protein [uncultured Candidatus Thioglobus sp.]|nr:Gll1843 protein [uncultured Candidatus Thioglobus sp.]